MHCQRKNKKRKAKKKSWKKLIWYQIQNRIRGMVATLFFLKKNYFLQEISIFEVTQSSHGMTFRTRFASQTSIFDYALSKPRMFQFSFYADICWFFCAFILFASSSFSYILFCRWSSNCTKMEYSSTNKYNLMNLRDDA